MACTSGTNDDEVWRFWYRFQCSNAAPRRSTLLSSSPEPEGLPLRFDVPP